MKFLEIFNGNKGFSDIALAILALAALIVIALFAYNVYKGMQESLAIQNCKLSISSHSIIVGASKEELFTTIKCPTTEIAITSLDTAKQKIAEDMHKCWYEWNRGDGKYFKGDGIFCAICSIYSFNDKGQNVKGFESYLNTNQIQVKYSGDNPGDTYIEYFSGFSHGDTSKLPTSQDVTFQNGDYLNTSQKYATIIVYASGKEAIAKALEGNKAAMFSGGGIVLWAGVAATVYGTSGVIGTIVPALITTGTVTSWSPVGWLLLGAALITVGTATVYTAIVAAGEKPSWISYIAFRPYNTSALNDLGCQYIPVSQVSNGK